MITNSCQINTLSQLYNHLKIRNVNRSVKIILKTKHLSHVTFTNKLKFLKPEGRTAQSKNNVFYSLQYTSHKSKPSVPQGYMGGITGVKGIPC
jgi:hypothetical protein